MKIHNCVLAIVMSAALAACGGGGGSAGTPGFGGGTGTDTGGGTDTGTGGGTVTPASYVMQLQLQNSAGADIASNSFAASDTVKLLATLKTSAGAAAPNEVVTFAESGSGLLNFTPTAATALTNASGQAVMEIKAKALDALGATTVSATATVAGTAYAASRNLAVTGAVVEGVDPQTLAKGVNFVSAVPADKSIVIAGAGGNGRSETAILQYKVVDGTGAAVPGVRVTFEAIPANVVTLNSTTGTTDASGLVAASVSSKTTPTSVVVKATVAGAALLTQSDTLTVTTGTAVPAAFDLSASKHVLNLNLSGDSSTIRIAVADANGNPVADGFPVVATTTYGRVGSSDRGGCTTVNGICEVEYQVQNPRPADGVRIPIVVTGQAYSALQGRDITISDTIYLNATSVSWVNLFPVGSNTPVTSFPLPEFDGTCKAMWTGELGTNAGFAAPAGATLAVESTSPVLTAAVTSGVPVMDSPNTRAPDATSPNSRTRTVLSFTLNNATANGTANLLFTVTAGTSVQQFAATVPYRACTPAT